MELSKIYLHETVEDKWYNFWIENGAFESVPDDRPPYTIVIPPPNVTGVLHMGHMLNNTLQDALIRRARLKGFNACWVPGTDHASIATEAKVVAMLAEKGIKKQDLTREKFLEYAWSWKEKYGGIILEQLKKLGCSCDWKRTRFTMDPLLSKAVLDAFVHLYNKNLIYRGVRMVNWDPQGLTAVSDEEVIYKEVASHLHYVKYQVLESETKWITVATSRPETILGDTAICVHPEDERYKGLVGKFALVPIVNRKVPIIADTYIDPEFGTGALKVTPAHDVNDYALGIKFNLPVIDTIAADGKMSPQAKFYVGEDRFVVRKKIIKELTKMGQVEKSEPITHKVGFSERTNAAIEPKLSMQWFVKMEHLAKPALEEVLNGNIQLIPEKFLNTYRHWMENVHDWCISRQLWWGQQIPAWYSPSGAIAVAKNELDALRILKNKEPHLEAKDLRRDEDVLDTWFSSWLWPLTVFDPEIIEKGWEGANTDLQYYYPTQDLVTAPEILFFWVARMIMAGKTFVGKIPFSKVYLTGIVRDKQGQKMSKSLGNSPNPLELIKKYGADGVRVGMMLSSPAGNDLLFDESHCEQGRNFANKIWNAFRLINGLQVDNSLHQSNGNKTASLWFKNRMHHQLIVINQHYDKYRMNDALMTTYRLVWDDYCAWYLEMIKPPFIDGMPSPIDSTTLQEARGFLEELLILLHPWMPFITEELWQQLPAGKMKGSIMKAKWPSEITIETELCIAGETLKDVLLNIRTLRQKHQISPKIPLMLYSNHPSFFPAHLDFPTLIIKMANLKGLESQIESIPNSASFLSGTTTFQLLLNEKLDLAEEKEKLLSELIYQEQFQAAVQKKLHNDRFMQNAKPELIALEKKKLSDADARIESLKKQLTHL